MKQKYFYYQYENMIQHDILCFYLYEQRNQSLYLPVKVSGLRMKPNQETLAAVTVKIHLLIV